MTGANDQQLIVDLMKMGAIDFIIKNNGFAETIPTIIDRAFEIILMRKTLQQSMEEIKKNELKLRMLFENIQDVFFIVSLSGTIEEVSPSVKNILGYESFELIHQDTRSFFSNPADYENIKRELILTKSSIVPFLVLKHKDLSDKYISIVCNIVNLDEINMKVIGVINDISERIQIKMQAISKTIEAEENERRKIAEAIHDDVGPTLSVLKLYFDLINTNCEDSLQRKNLLLKVNDLIDDTIQKIRAITTNLSPNTLDELGLKCAIELFTEKIAYASKIKFNIEIPDCKLKKASKIFLYRAIIELINNSLKHAKADLINIQVALAENEISLFYSDNGSGFLFEAKPIPIEIKGHGLLSIISRVSLMSGTYKIKTSPGNGFQISINIKNKY
jgi:PAS domain S-box-containing protein